MQADTDQQPGKGVTPFDESKKAFTDNVAYST